jgi:hypothetical protein
MILAYYRSVYPGPGPKSTLDLIFLHDGWCSTRPHTGHPPGLSHPAIELKHACDSQASAAIGRDAGLHKPPADVPTDTVIMRGMLETTKAICSREQRADATMITPLDSSRAIPRVCPANLIK